VPSDPNPTSHATQIAELLARARGGDRGAASELLARYAPHVRGMTAVRMGRTLVDLHDFDDVAQEALLTALASVQRLECDTPAGFVAWLSSIVESRLVDAHRRGRAEKRGGGTVRRRADLGVTTVSTLTGADPARSPSQVAGAHEIDARLERALLGLGSPLREVVYSKLVLDMSHAEIAASFRLASADSSRALLHKGLAQLRQRLESPKS
jgi:RNA polymerase sigma factor (sigma-70 family)